MADDLNEVREASAQTVKLPHDKPSSGESESKARVSSCLSVAAPLTPTSQKTSSQPASNSASSCEASFCSSVEMRAYPINMPFKIASRSRSQKAASGAL